jgi:large subunit ribosomal protein L15
MKLNDLNDNPGSSKNRMRVGRGIGSGKGKTAGRGVKGQKARTGVAIKGFEGGQMPLHRRLPKRGFWNPFSTDYNEVNLGRIQLAVDSGKLDTSAPVTLEALIAAGVISKARDGVKILGNGELTAKLTFEVAGASKSAVAAIEKAGGSVTLLTAAPRLLREMNCLPFPFLKFCREIEV